MCACWKYYPGTSDLTFIRVKYDPASSLFTSGFYMMLINPILHSAWLNHALTLKSNTAKYYSGKKSSFFAYLPKVLL
jgi:hypothetical protein